MADEGTCSGFRIVGGVLDEIECLQVLAALSEMKCGRGRAGARHLLAVPVIASVARDERLVALAAEFIGGAPLPFRATLCEKSSSANWLVPWHQDTALPLVRHVDTPGWGPWSRKAGILQAHAPAFALDKVVALRLHLDDTTPLNGPLRILPGSQALGLLDDDAVFELAHGSSPVDCVVPRGGVMAMRPLLVHSSSKARSCHPRRVLHVEYCTSMEVGDGAELAVA